MLGLTLNHVSKRCFRGNLPYEQIFRITHMRDKRNPTKLRVALIVSCSPNLRNHNSEMQEPPSA